MNSIETFTLEARELKLDFFEFSLIEDEGLTPYIIGDLHLHDKEGKYLDTYNIRIEIKEDYPKSLPVVYETSRRIPINIDWHVFPDGHCCIVTPPEEFLICKKRISLEQFIIKYLLPYFHNQLFREIEGYFLNERSHGHKGIKEFFFDIFNTKKSENISDWLFFIAKGKEPDRTADCFCGSKKKYRKCHREAFRELSLLSIKDLLYYSALIKVDKT